MIPRTYVGARIESFCITIHIDTVDNNSMSVSVRDSDLNARICLDWSGECCIVVKNLCLRAGEMDGFEAN